MTSKYTELVVVRIFCKKLLIDIMEIFISKIVSLFIYYVCKQSSQAKYWNMKSLKMSVRKACKL